MEAEKKQFIESFLTIYLFKYGSFLALNLNTDKLYYLLKDDINLINSLYKEFLLISMDSYNNIIVEYKNKKLLENEVEKFLEILKSGFGKTNSLLYIKKEFSKEIYNFIYPFFEFIEGDRYKIIKEIDLKKYLDNLDNFKLKKMLLFIHYGIANDSKINTLKSIKILSEIMDKYPDFSSFYLLRMRQRFNFIYKILIGVSKFNKLISTEKGKNFLLNYAGIKECFDDLEKANKLLPNYFIYYFFKGKIFLHLLDSSGLDDLLKYMKLGKLSYDNNVISWFGVYYLQIGELEKAKEYLEKVNYSLEDKYKEYSKLLFLYLKIKDKKKFFEFINDKKKKVEILLFNEGNYYRYNNGMLEKWEDIDDLYDHRTKMGYKLNFFYKIFNKRYSSKEEYFNDIFNNISRNYYDHWDPEGQKKVIFYSYDSYTEGQKVFLQKHENLVKKNNMKEFIVSNLKSKKILIIGLGKQGKKLVNFFSHLGLKDNIIGNCRTKETKIFCEKKFGINVNLDLDLIKKKYKEKIGFIFIGIKPEGTQEYIFFNIVNDFPDIPLLIEKSFISESKINNLNFSHTTGIIVEEYSYLNFFKNINSIKNNIKSIDLVSDLNKVTYNEIIGKKLSLMSYIYGYLFFLEIEEIKLLKNIKISNGYKLFFLINNKIIINFIFRKTKKKYNYNTIIYNEEFTKSVFNANLDYFIFRGKKFKNDIIDGYFEIFFKNKIFDLISKKIILKEEVKKIDRFNQFNLFDDNIIL